MLAVAGVNMVTLSTYRRANGWQPDLEALDAAITNSGAEGTAVELSIQSRRRRLPRERPLPLWWRSPTAMVSGYSPTSAMTS